MGHLSLSLLGTFAAVLDGKPAHGFASNKVRALLAYLAVEADRPHRRESLAALLWENFAEQPARTNLRNSLANLRNVLHDRNCDHPFIIVTRDTLQFNQQADVDVDVLAFSTFLNAPHPDTHPLEQALSLYRGSFLQGFSLKDSLAFDDWALLTRERLHRRAFTALGDLTAHYSAQERWLEACDTARRQVEMEPWNEETHRSLIHFLAVSGQRSAALAQFETCRQVLESEFGVTPSRETVSLYQHIRDGTPDQHVKPTADQSPALTAAKHNLPAQLTPFVGRQEEVTTITGYLDNPACRLLSLVGPGGSGKTRLAIETGFARLDHWVDGVYIVSLASLQSTDALFYAMAETLELPLSQNQEPRQHLLHYLKNKNLMLILDNFDRFTGSVESINESRKHHDASDFITEILKSAPDVKLMITSRIKLNLPEEKAISVRGLTYPHPDELGAVNEPYNKVLDVSRYSALVLFVVAARRQHPDFQMNAANQMGIIRICSLIDGLPLGILLASSWMYVASPDIVADQIERNLDLLKSEHPDLEERQRSLRSVFKQSWDMLSPGEQNLLISLSYFRGKFSFTAGQAVAGANLPGLKKMIDKSLLYHVPTGYYEMHEVIRTFAQENLEQDQNLSCAVKEKHTVYYMTTLAQWWSEIKGPRQIQALQEVGNELENIRLAWQRTLTPEKISHLRHAYMGVMYYFGSARRFREARVWFRETVEVIEVALASCSTDDKKVERYQLMRIQAVMVAVHVLTDRWALGTTDRTHHNAQKCRTILDNLEQAGLDVRWERSKVICMASINLITKMDELHQALAISTDFNDDWGKAWALENLGWAYFHLDSYDEAKGLWLRGLDISRQMRCPLLINSFLSHLGYTAWETGDYYSAQRMWAELLKYYRQTNNKAFLAYTLLSAVYISMLHGQLEKAKILATESIELSTEIGERFYIEVGYRRLGLVYLAAGEYKKAQKAFTESIDIGRVTGNTGDSVMSSIRLAITWLHLGKYRGLAHKVQESLETAQEIGIKRNLSLYALLLGRLALGKSEYQVSLSYTQEGITNLERMGPRRELGSAYADFCLAAMGRENITEAQQHLRQALGYALDTGDFVACVQVLPAAAIFFANQGQIELAENTLQKALRFPMVANSRWFADILNQHFPQKQAPKPEVFTPEEQEINIPALHSTLRDLLASIE